MTGDPARRPWDDPRAPRVGTLLAALLFVVGLIAAAGAGPADDESRPSAGFTTPVSTAGGTAGPASDAMSAAVAPTNVPGAAATDSTGAPAPVGAGEPVATSPPRGQRRVLPSGRGMTDTTIRVGIGWTNTASFAASCTALGADCEGAEDLDPKSWAQKVVDWVNANGGIAGRTVEPLYFEMDVTRQLTAEGRAEIEQQQCAHWTEDNSVFAVIPSTAHEGVLLDCAARSGTVFVSSTNTEGTVDDQRFAEVRDHYYRPASMLADRREQVVVDALVRDGYFGKGAKVGLMIHDRPASRHSAESTLKPALAAHGIEVVSEVAYPDIVESPWSTYVLKFRNDGVTHVLYGSSASSGPVWFFSQQADSQGYRPYYGFATDQEPAKVAATSGAQVGPTATVVGWLPHEDSGYDKYPFPLNPADQLCHEIIGRVAHPGYCDGLWFLQRALDGARELSPAGMAASVAQLGESYVSPYTYGTSFAPGRHDGATTVSLLRYDEQCECFLPTGAPTRVG